MTHRARRACIVAAAALGVAGIVAAFALVSIPLFLTAATGPGLAVLCLTGRRSLLYRDEHGAGLRSPGPGAAPSARPGPHAA